ncbi:hypothetical protein EW146_g9572 [Bondarzewia mesenterica]|uniref:Uncharacterized protein n=1 Tax=Bondarzewia mesenterica TaxID=1095465 RepID=A0A4S4L5M5_9AGAM|nr:hypothetical protein EW146_g9572 [Bondarzewia mesenterica]
MSANSDSPPSPSRSPSQSSGPNSSSTSSSSSLSLPLQHLSLDRMHSSEDDPMLPPSPQGTRPGAYYSKLSLMPEPIDEDAVMLDWEMDDEDQADASGGKLQHALTFCLSFPGCLRSSLHPLKELCARLYARPWLSLPACSEGSCRRKHVVRPASVGP